MSRRLLRNTLLGILAVLLLLAGIFLWLAATQSGTRWLIGRAAPLLPTELSLGEIDGTLLEGITLTGAGWTDDAQAVRIGRLATAVELLPVLRREIRVRVLDVRGVDIEVGARTPNAGPDEPFSIDLPLDLIFDDVTVEDIQIQSGDTQIDLARVEFNGELRGSDLQVKHLQVDSDLVHLMATATGRLKTSYDARANVAWTLRLPEQPVLSGNLRLRGDAARYQVTHELKTPYAVLTEGQLSLVDDGIEFNLMNSWQSIDIAAGDDRSVKLSDGSLRVTGDLDEVSYEVRSSVLTEDVPPLLVTSIGSHVANTLNIKTLSVWSERGRVSASGQVMTVAGSPWQLAFEVSELDASLADARLRGSIDARGTSSGQITDDRPVTTVNITGLAGDLNGHALDGSAGLAYGGDGLRIENAVVSAGDNVARFSAGFGSELQLDASLDLAELGQLGLDLSGRLNGDIRAATNLETLEIDGAMSGTDLAWQDFSATRLDAQFAIPRSGRGAASTRITAARVGETLVDSIDLRASGTALAHQLTAKITADDITADATVAASFANERWSGSVAALSVFGDLLGAWQLQESADFAVSRAGFDLDRACLASSADNGFACAELKSNEAGELRFDVDINELPLVALPITWPEGSIVAGLIEGGANGSLVAGRLAADAELRIRDLSVRAIFEGDEVAATFERALATAAIADNRLDGRLELRLQNSVDNLTTNVVVNDLFDRESTISGDSSVELNDLALVGFFFPSVTNPSGRVAGSVDIAGILSAPDIRGKIELSDGSFGFARAGITVTDVSATLQQLEVGRLAIEGRARSGDGNLAITGETTLSSSMGIRTEMALNGENFTLFKLPDWQVTASPAITLVIDEQQARVTGDLAIPAANITFRELPASVQKPSPDVVIHRDDAATVPRRYVVSLDVRTSLGDAVNLSGFGLTTGLEGSVRITGRSDTTYTSSGRLVLRDGRYSAYGQELNIDSGELIFSGPLTNPTLNVRASRTASDGTVAGIHLTGTPKQPRSEVYSEPALGDVEALSYLLTGRPLSNATGEQGDTLNQAAFALGLSSAGSVVSRLRNDLGLETLGVQGSADDRQFFAGKRFGNRLFVEYAYGIVDNLGTLLLRYQLNSRLVVESRSGTVRTVDVVYSVKKP